MFKSSLKKKLAPTVKNITFEQNCVFRCFRPVFGVGEGRETSGEVPTCLGNVFGIGGSIYNHVKRKQLKNRYNSSFAWSYGSSVGTVRIPVKNCTDSWGQSLKNQFRGPVTSKWPIVSIYMILLIGRTGIGTIENRRCHRDLWEYRFILSICLVGWGFMSGQ